MAIRNFRQHLQTFLHRPFLGELSERFADTVLGWVHDALAEAASDALRMGWVKDTRVPVDALPHLASNFGLPAYPIETPAQHVARMGQAWDLWSKAGDESSIESQLATLGFTGAKIYTPAEWPERGAGYWSQFWLVIPAGSHDVTAPGPVIGAMGALGTGHVVGPVGLTSPVHRTLKSVVRQFKPSDWVARSVTFVLSGLLCDTGVICDGGAICGGESATTSI